MNDTRDPHDETAQWVTAGGGTHDVTGRNAAAHVAESNGAAGTRGEDGAHGAHDVATVHDGHEDQPLGPIDWPAWRAALVGIAVGGLVCVLLYLAIR